MKTIRSLVVTGFGINCEEEMAAAGRLAGAETEIVHLNEVFSERVSIQDFDLLNFPGGFSFGDDLGSAKVLSNKFRYKKMASGRLFLDEIKHFLDSGKYIIGVCNGFQALVKMGLLPNVQGRFEQEATLTYNASGKFEDRWVRCSVNQSTVTPFLKDLRQLELPVRHGEGKLVFGNDNLRSEVEQRHLNCLTYVDQNGNSTGEYPFNPNGSELNCAALNDPSGQVFGLMPHPEAFLSLYNHPNWGRLKRQNPNISEEGQGLRIFKNIVRHLQQK